MILYKARSNMRSQKEHLWQPGTNLRHWLFAILHNLRISDVRKLAREQHALANERTATISSVFPDLSTRIALLELDRAIAVLPQARRRVVLLIGLQEKSYGEAAAILGVPTGTVRSPGWHGRVRRFERPALSRGRVRRPFWRKVVRDMTAWSHSSGRGGVVRGQS
jgi:DNA-directed RNA polymerase specialized sigma24 family protein